MVIPNEILGHIYLGCAPLAWSLQMVPSIEVPVGSGSRLAKLRSQPAESR